MRSSDVFFPGDTPLSDEEVRRMGWEPTAQGWKPRLAPDNRPSRAPSHPVPIQAPPGQEELVGRPGSSAEERTVGGVTAPGTTNPSSPQPSPRTRREQRPRREPRGRE